LIVFVEQRYLHLYILVFLTERSLGQDFFDKLLCSQSLRLFKGERGKNSLKDKRFSEKRFKYLTFLKTESVGRYFVDK
jgi:hypothetical protein